MPRLFPFAQEVGYEHLSIDMLIDIFEGAHGAFLLVAEMISDIDGGGSPTVLLNDILLHGFVKKCNKQSHRKY